MMARTTTEELLLGEGEDYNDNDKRKLSSSSSEYV